MQIKNEFLLHFEQVESEMLAFLGDQKIRRRRGGGDRDMGATMALGHMP